MFNRKLKRAIEALEVSLKYSDDFMRKTHYDIVKTRDEMSALATALGYKITYPNHAPIVEKLNLTPGDTFANRQDH